MYKTEKGHRQLPCIALHPQSLWQVSAHTTYVHYGHYTPSISIHTGNPVPFLYTATSLLPEHSVLTDVQQATGRNGQQWITCRSGGQGTSRPQILMGNNVVLSSSTDNSATIGLGTQRPNGLYRCLSAQSQRQYFSLFLRNSGKYISYLHRCQTQLCVRYVHMYNSTAYSIQLIELKSVLLAVLVQLHDVPSSRHSTNTHCKCLGHLNVDNCITTGQQSGEIYCRGRV